MAKMTRDKWGALALAGSHFSMGIINRYPQSIQGYVAYQHETAQNTAQVLKEEEAARQAAKKAHRLANRTLIGSVAGAAFGGIGGAVAGIGGAAAGSSTSILSGMSAGSQIGSGIAGGNASAISGGLKGLITPSASMGLGGTTGGGGITYGPNGEIIVNGQVVGYTAGRGV